MATNQEIESIRSKLQDELIRFYDNLQNRPYPTLLAALEDLHKTLQAKFQRPTLKWKIAIGTWILSLQLLAARGIMTEQIMLLEHIDRATTMLAEWPHAEPPKPI